MRFASFVHDSHAGWGAIDEGFLRPLNSFPDLLAALEAQVLDRIDIAGAPRLEPGAVTWLPVIPHPRKIICIGVNYDAHRRETGRPEVQYPTVFTRFADTQIGHGSDLIRPDASSNFDFEGELAVIIGIGGRAIPEAEATAHIAGYACYNDGSVRDWQRHTSQFIPGKNFPATGAFGPWMVTPDEMGPLGPQRLQTRLNGVCVQDAHLADMIFDVPKLIAYCSRFTRLDPGDVIVTGTPAGVGERRDPPLWLKPGDTVEVEIDGIGVLRNRVAAETTGAMP